MDDPASKDELARIRRAYAEYVMAVFGQWHDRVYEAFATVPREAFLGPGPWNIGTIAGGHETRTTDPAILYNNAAVALIADKDINNGEPALHARCMASLDIRPGARVVHVGAGTGYYAAILAELVGPTGHVDALEVEPSLVAEAQSNLAPWPQVSVQPVSGLDFPVEAADAIYVNAGFNFFPRPWLEGLAVGGRLVMPLTAEAGWGLMLCITRCAGGYAAESVMPVGFVPAEGRLPAEQAKGLEAIRAQFQTASQIKSLRLAPDAPDDTCWLEGNGWWLSTQPIED